MRQRMLLIGSGGREHALAWKLTQSSKLEKLYVAPGNDGMGQLAERVPILATDMEGLLRFAKEKEIDFTIVGPDEPLALGIVDRFQSAGMKIFGPSRLAAEIEASKAFSKQFMERYGIPTASFGVFRDFEETSRYLEKVGVPIVIKASGLALGKGVFVCQRVEEAQSALRQILKEHIFGEAGKEVVIEEFLEGPEISIHAFSDGKNYKLLPTAQDHKPVFDDDKGPNTGGMGTIVPVSWVTDEQMKKTEDEIVRPVLEGLSREGRPFTGLLYPGLKMTAEGPKVLEFNARFGDPETQSYMRLLKTDLLEVFEACARGRLSGQSIAWHPGFAACIVLASGGYPGSYKKGVPISGIEEAEKVKDVVLFHAGTEFREGRWYTSGGRVLGVTAVGDTLQAALDRAYEAVNVIYFEGMHYRKDIGAKALVR